MLRRAARFVTVVGTTAARPTWWSAAGSTLQRVGAPFEGDGYYVTRVSPHLRPGAAGFRTHFEAERADARTRADVMRRLPRRRRRAPLLRRLPGHRHRHRRPGQPRADRGEVPVARHATAARDVRAWATLLHAVRRRRPGLRDPARGRHARWWSPSRPAICAGPTSSARAGTAGSRCPTTPEAANNKRLMRTRAGSLLEFDDTDGAAKVTLSMQSGHKVVLDDGAQRSTVTHANGCVDHVHARGPDRDPANSTVEVTPRRSTSTRRWRPSTAWSSARRSSPSGVVSPSYTPGAGNIW